MCAHACRRASVEVLCEGDWRLLAEEEVYVCSFSVG